MSQVPEAARATATAAARGETLPVPVAPEGLAQRVSGKLQREWLPRAAWSIERTGRPGLIGIALLSAAALFLFSTHQKIAAEVQSLAAEVQAAQSQARTVVKPVGPPPELVFPARGEVPDILRQLFAKATQAGLEVDSGKYEIKSLGASGVVRYEVAFPVSGPYPQIRAFIDSTLASMPEVALSDLVLDRKSIGDGNIDAQLRMTVFTRGTP